MGHFLCPLCPGNFMFLLVTVVITLRMGDGVTVCHDCTSWNPFCGEQMDTSFPDAVATVQCADTDTCFLRMDKLGEIHRGCADWWMDTQVDTSYLGCRVQRLAWLGEMLWCFCEQDYCNGDLEVMLAGKSVAATGYSDQGRLEPSTFEKDPGQPFTREKNPGPGRTGGGYKPSVNQYLGHQQQTAETYQPKDRPRHHDEHSLDKEDDLDSTGQKTDRSVYREIPRYRDHPAVYLRPIQGVYRVRERLEEEADTRLVQQKDPPGPPHRRMYREQPPYKDSLGSKRLNNRVRYREKKQNGYSAVNRYRENLPRISPKMQNVHESVDHPEQDGTFQRQRQPKARPRYEAAEQPDGSMPGKGALTKHKDKRRRNRANNRPHRRQVYTPQPHQNTPGRHQQTYPAYKVLDHQEHRHNRPNLPRHKPQRQSLRDERDRPQHQRSRPQSPTQRAPVPTLIGQRYQQATEEFQLQTEPAYNVIDHRRQLEQKQHEQQQKQKQQQEQEQEQQQRQYRPVNSTHTKFISDVTDHGQRQTKQPESQQPTLIIHDVPDRLPKLPRSHQDTRAVPRVADPQQTTVTEHQSHQAKPPRDKKTRKVKGQAKTDPVNSMRRIREHKRRGDQQIAETYNQRNLWYRPQYQPDNHRQHSQRGSNSLRHPHPHQPKDSHQDDRDVAQLFTDVLDQLARGKGLDHGTTEPFDDWDRLPGPYDDMSTGVFQRWYWHADSDRPLLRPGQTRGQEDSQPRKLRGQHVDSINHYDNEYPVGQAEWDGSDQEKDLPWGPGDTGQTGSTEMEVWNINAAASRSNDFDLTSGDHDARGGATDLDHDLDRQDFYCWDCYSASRLCGQRVDTARAQDLGKTRCLSSQRCFLRDQGGVLYRGCADGWSLSSIRTDYLGCRQQRMDNSSVEWCFCDASFCNGDDLDSLRLKYGQATLP